jgi:glycosyltransferase involved in cell wall biosynthesis
MKLLINGYFLAKPKTGMGQYITQILKHQTWDEEIIIAYPEYLKEYIVNIPKSIQKYLIIVKTPYTRNDLIAQMIWEGMIMPAQVKKHQADILWSPYPTITQISGVKHIITLHDVIYWKYPEYIHNWRMRIYVSLLKLSVQKSSHITTVSEFSAQEIAQIFEISPQNISIVSNASPRISKSKKIHKKNHILYEGGLDIRKNVPRLIEAFALITSEFPDTKLYITGNYFKTSLIPDIPEYIRNHHLEDKVKLLGYISDKEMTEYIQSARILVYPSLYEGFGIPILEGMSLGTPVITSNIGAMAEVAGDAAYQVDPYSFEDIAKAMREVLSDEMMQQSLIHKGYERAREFSWHKSAEDMGKVLTDIYSSHTRL